MFILKLKYKKDILNNINKQICTYVNINCSLIGQLQVTKACHNLNYLKTVYTYYKRNINGATAKKDGLEDNLKVKVTIKS